MGSAYYYESFSPERLVYLFFRNSCHILVISANVIRAFAGLVEGRTTVGTVQPSRAKYRPAAVPLSAMHLTAWYTRIPVDPPS